MVEDVYYGHGAGALKSSQKRAQDRARMVGRRLPRVTVVSSPRVSLAVWPDGAALVIEEGKCLAPLDGTVSR